MRYRCRIGYIDQKGRVVRELQKNRVGDMRHPCQL